MCDLNCVIMSGIVIGISFVTILVCIFMISLRERVDNNDQ